MRVVPSGVVVVLLLGVVLVPPARGEERVTPTAAPEPDAGRELAWALVSPDPARAAEAERALAEASSEVAVSAALALRERVRELEEDSLPSAVGPPMPQDHVSAERAAAAKRAVQWNVRFLEMSDCEARGWFGNPPCDGRAPLRVLGERGRDRILAAARHGRGTQIHRSAEVTGLEGQRVALENVHTRTFSEFRDPATTSVGLRIPAEDVSDGLRLSLRPLVAERGGRIVAEADARVGRIATPASSVRTGSGASFERPEWVGANVRRLIDVPDGGTFLLGGLGTCPGGSSTAILVTVRVVDVPRPEGAR
jgi:hypothetical protein